MKILENGGVCGQFMTYGAQTYNAQKDVGTVRYEGEIFSSNDTVAAVMSSFTPLTPAEPISMPDSLSEALSENLLMLLEDAAIDQVFYPYQFAWHDENGFDSINNSGSQDLQEIYTAAQQKADELLGEGVWTITAIHEETPGL